MSGTTSWTKALVALAATSVAFAVQAAPGEGIRLGGSDARLHPFLDLESRYDSNVTYSPSNAAIGDLILHVRPGLEVKAPGEMAALEFSGALDWAQYLGIEGDTTGLSRMYGYASLAAAFNRSGSVTPRVDNAFQRTISTTSLTAVGAAVVSNTNTLTLALPWKPGGGALVAAANAQWLVESYEEYQAFPGVNPSDLSYNQYRVGGDVQWRFLPRTTALLQGGWYTRVPNKIHQPGDATGWDVFTGLTGLLSPRVAATAKVGFGGISALASEAANLPANDTSTFLADVALEWLPLETISFKAGYVRGLGLDPTVSTYISDAARLGGKIRLGSRAAFSMGVNWDRFSFQSIDGGSTTFIRVDPTIDAFFGRWLTASVGYVYSGRTAEWPSAFGGKPPDYSKNEVFLRGGVTY